VASFAHHLEDLRKQTSAVQVPPAWKFALRPIGSARLVYRCPFAAQERGEVASARDGDHSRSDRERLPTSADIGLTRKDIHEARIIRDAETTDPGIVRRTVDVAIEAGELHSPSCVHFGTEHRASAYYNRTFIKPCG
jgi:hypothetical protein